MNSNPYQWAGVAALLLAVLFPIYWLHPVNYLAVTNFQEILRDDLMTLNGWDALFVLIGALEVYVYVMLARMCKDQVNGELPAILLYVMAGIVVVFTSTVLFDVAVAVGLIPEVTSSVMFLVLGASITLLVLYSLVALIFAISLLIRFAALPTLIKIFAIGILLLSLMQLTIILAVVNVFLFPVLLVLLAIQFFRNDHSVEVV
ncbi:hypothetical protein FM042_09425 [Aliidiomarina halalkaliphila]|uniref:DUF4386 domain-containing protein n=1 Tax=Aliidiomarina halalkaliphila TaxID=2593535 RepID=A0A552X0C1_9GAMM|nr:hypothetical protein [Aliidiomarina halalkaliphila]TRW48385.1 hypothetical protein FM042_09425 [Aliidiomarina halalkaliphila]